MTQAQIQGWKWAGITALISGVSVFANGIVVKGIDPLIHTTVKNGFVGLLILAVLLLTGEWINLTKLNRNQLLKLGLIGVIGGSIPFVLFFAGLKMIGAVEGAMIHKTLIFWVALIASGPLLKEKVSGKMMVGVALLYLSNFTLGFSGFGKLGVGHVMVLLATLFWAVENVVAKKTLKDISVNLVVAARMVLGSAILIGLVVQSGKVELMQKLTTNQWAMLMGVGLLLFGYVMTWYRALKLATAVEVTSILVGATVVTSVLQAIMTKTVPNMGMWGQIGFILAGIGMVYWANKSKAGHSGARLKVEQ